MTIRAAVLGCGMVGATIARDLASDSEFEVAAVDVSEANLKKLAGQPRLRTIRADLGDVVALRKVIEPCDIVLGALPSRIGFQSLRTIIEAKKPYCDITFMPEDAIELDELAKRHGVTAVVDCGVSPGLSNLCVGHAFMTLARCERAIIYVGGLPKQRYWPFQYKAPFAPGDVIEEYTRPARMRIAGQSVTKPALSDPELVDFTQVGTLEGFNTDGLRSLLTTLDIPTMLEKTLRYPGHIELMRVFRETGLFALDEIDVGGARVRPRDVTARLLFPKWTYAPGEEEFTVMRVVAEGVNNEKRVRLQYELYDETDVSTGTTSMARTTAYPCAIMARWMARGWFAEKGVIPLELAVRREGLFGGMIDELASRGVKLDFSSSEG
jgi:saccharopine dehydrogenase-like NADP-dependent oxidoreductase